MNIMHLHSPESAILSAIIFNAIIIPILIPLALRGVAYKPDRCFRIASSQLADLRFGRCNCPVHWYQVDRYDCKFIHVKVKSILKTSSLCMKIGGRLRK